MGSFAGTNSWWAVAPPFSYSKELVIESFVVESSVSARLSLGKDGMAFFASESGGVAATRGGAWRTRR